MQRKIYWLAVLSLVAVLCVHAQETTSAETQSATAGQAGVSFDPLSGHPGSLARLRDYRQMRVSSEDRAGNADMRRFEPGEKKTVAQLEGPGEITHLWTTIATPDKMHLRNTVIRIFWDDNEFPSVECPIGDFYGLGHGEYYYFNNPVQAIGTINGMNCFWPMPFKKSARVEIENQGDKRLDAYYFYVDWRKLKEFPEDAAYFHASYRQAFPNVDGKRYLILETDGAPGHFVGVSLSIHTLVGGWWGEGDDVFTIDGEETPSLWGTGSEDYFSGAWCYGETFYNDYFGLPLRKKMNHDANNLWNVYRLHLESPITFQKSIKVEIEHGQHGFDNTRPISNNNYTSVAYWYQAAPQRLKSTLPPAAERISQYTAPGRVPGIYDGVGMEVKQPEGVQIEQQGMNGFEREGLQWHNHDHTWIKEAKQDQPIEFTFETTETQTGPMVLRMTKAPDYGRAKVELDGKVLLSNFNGYAERVEPMSVEFGEKTLPAGKHTLRFTLLGKDDRATNSFMGFDYLRVGGQKPAEEDAGMRQAGREQQQERKAPRQRQQQSTRRTR